MKLSPEILREAALFVEFKLNSLEDGSKLYNQTIRLAQQCDAISVQADLAKSDRMVVHLAALFVHMGQLPESEISADEVAASYCREANIDVELIDSIVECMKSIKPPQMPVSAAAQVLCDAVNSFLIEKSKAPVENLPIVTQQLFKGHTNEEKYREWYQYLESLCFFTPASRKLFDKARIKQLTWLGQQFGLNKKDQPGTSTVTKDGHVIFDSDVPRLERGTETLFKIASRRHTELMAMAHQKTGFMLSINAIILSVVLSVLSTKLQDNPQLVIPTLLLVLTCLGTITVSILATKPVVVGLEKGASFQRDTQNILFFGHYYHLPWKEYRHNLREISNDTDSLFDALAKDIFYQGVVLQKKYKLLSLSYNIFLGGLILSVLAFILSYFL